MNKTLTSLLFVGALAFGGCTVDEPYQTKNIRDLYVAHGSESSVLLEGRVDIVENDRLLITDSTGQMEIFRDNEYGLHTGDFDSIKVVLSKQDAKRNVMVFGHFDYFGRQFRGRYIQIGKSLYPMYK